jgi:hypothetical protein
MFISMWLMFINMWRMFINMWRMLINMRQMFINMRRMLINMRQMFINMWRMLITKWRCYRKHGVPRAGVGCCTARLPTAQTSAGAAEARGDPASAYGRQVRQAGPRLVAENG